MYGKLYKVRGTVEKYVVANSLDQAIEIYKSHESNDAVYYAEEISDFIYLAKKPRTKKEDL